MILQTLFAAGLTAAIWEIGKSLIKWGTAASVGVSVYALSKWVVLPIFAGWVQPAFPAQFACAASELGLDTCVAIILAAYNVRLTLMAIRWAAR